MFRKEKGNEYSQLSPPWSRIFFLPWQNFSNFPIVFYSLPSPCPNSTPRPPLLGDKNPQVSLCLHSEERKQTREPTLGRPQRAELLPQWLRCPRAEHRGVVGELSRRPGLRGCWKWGQCCSPGLHQIRSCPRREPCKDTNPMTSPSHTSLSLHGGGWASWWLMDTCPAHGQVSFLPKDRRLRVSPGTPTDRIHPKG